MKNFKLVSLMSAAVFALSVSSSALAAGRTVDLQVGLGAASTTNVIRQIGGLSTLIRINEEHNITGLFGISSVTPSISLGAGFQYSYTVHGNRKQGFHVGGGVGMGASGGAFFFNFNPVVGTSFSIPNLEHILLTADVGPALLVTTTGADFIVGAAPFLGLAIHYVF